MNPTLHRLTELLIECQGNADSSSANKAELNDLLRDSEANREFAARFLMDGEILSELLATHEISDISSRRSSLRVPEASVSRWKTKRWWYGIAAALLAAAVFGIWNSQVDTAPLAVVQDTVGTGRDSPLGQLGGPLATGSYELDKGLATIRFRNGVEMIVRAPSRFEIVDEFLVLLHQGTARASASESGHGFTIETQAARLVDLGTEFGVTVDEVSGESQIHVFDGRVNIEGKRGHAEVTSLGLGDTARIREGQLERIRPPKPGTYPSADDLGLARWQYLDAELRHDKDLILYYNFTQQEQNRLLLQDEAIKGESVDGKISGARWVTGRWPGKSALLFDGPGDAVELEIEEELPQLTFSAWIKADRHEYPLTPILNSDGWSEGDLHIQYSRSSGALFAGVHIGIWKEAQH
ncbi:MAG: FecR domain-containing protein, partial [Verrucomicrobiota bacterium]